MTRLPIVELLYFPECPHVEAARGQLRRALERAGLEPRWTEHDVSSAAAPAHARGFGSPTVLVDGADVTGAGPSGSAACRLYLGTEVAGAPPLEAIVAALRRAGA